MNAPTLTADVARCPGYQAVQHVLDLLRSAWSLALLERMLVVA